MKFRLLLGVMLIWAFINVQPAMAYLATLESVPVPYEVVTITGDPTVEQVILGELSDSPEMFEVSLDTEFVLTVELRALPNSSVLPDFSGIVIKVIEPRGVEEVARLKSIDSSWEVTRDGEVGLKYLAGGTFSGTVPAGTYRIEVSSPTNIGKYMLVIGGSPSTESYLSSLQNIAETYDFYSVSRIWMFSSPYVHYPLGILVILVLFSVTFYWQRKRNHHA